MDYNNRELFSNALITMLRYNKCLMEDNEDNYDQNEYIQIGDTWSMSNSYWSPFDEAFYYKNNTMRQLKAIYRLSGEE